MSGVSLTVGCVQGVAVKMVERLGRMFVNGILIGRHNHLWRYVILYIQGITQYFILYCYSIKPYKIEYKTSKTGMHYKEPYQTYKK